jgi:hypothetical protein
LPALGLLTGELKVPQNDDDLESSEAAATKTDLDLSEDEPDEDVITASADEIGHSISSLFRLTVGIQNLSSRDRMERIEKIDVSAYEPSDINHVKEKHRLGEDDNYLLERLGKANTKRRQLLKYNEKHHEKLVGRRREDTRNRNDGDSNDGDEVGNQGAERKNVEVQDMIGFDEDDYTSGEASTTMQTTISTLYENYGPDSFENDQLDDDARSETDILKHHTQLHPAQLSVLISYVFHLRQMGTRTNRLNARIVSKW